jgi:hypothetical protein
LNSRITLFLLRLSEEKGPFEAKTFGFTGNALAAVQLLDGSNLPMIPKDFQVLDTANNRMRATPVRYVFLFYSAEAGNGCETMGRRVRSYTYTVSANR